MSEPNADIIKMFTGVLNEKAPGPAPYVLPAIADLTWSDIQKMDGEQLKSVRRHPEGKVKIDEILAARAAAKGVKIDEAVAEQAALDAEAARVAAEASAVAGTVLETPAEAVVVPTPEEEAATKAAADAEAARVAAEAAAAEASRISAEAAVKALQEAEAAKTPKRFVYDFQARDEAGNPIGNRTHLEASSQEELDQKKEESYLNAVRAIDRLKKQKPTFRKETPIQATQEELDAAAKDLASEDAAVRAAAVRKLAGAEAEVERAKTRLAEENARQAKESYAFLRDHLTDYNNCEANNVILAQFLSDNNLEWTKENLDIALGNVESQLAPVIVRSAPAPVSAPPEVNPPAPAQPAATATAAPAAAPAAPAAPATPAAAEPVAPVVPAPPVANPPVAAPARRPGVNAGIVPGSTLSGVAPAAKTPAQTRTELIKELKAMLPAEMKRRHQLDPKFYDKVNALLAKK